MDCLVRISICYTIFNWRFWVSSHHFL